jgi:hypothetical protein
MGNVGYSAIRQLHSWKVHKLEKQSASKTNTGKGAPIAAEIGLGVRTSTQTGATLATAGSRLLLMYLATDPNALASTLHYCICIWLKIRARQDNEEAIAFLVQWSDVLSGKGYVPPIFTAIGASQHRPLAVRALGNVVIPPAREANAKQ